MSPILAFSDSSVSSISDEQLNELMHQMNKKYAMKIQFTLAESEQNFESDETKNEKLCVILQDYINDYYNYLDKYRVMFEMAIKDYQREQFVQEITQTQFFKITKATIDQCQFR